MVERILSATEARVHFGDLLRRVAEDGETIVVERAGVPRAVVMGPAEYERLRSRGAGAGWLGRVLTAKEQVVRELQGQSVPTPEEVLRQTREERDEQLDRLR